MIATSITIREAGPGDYLDVAALTEAAYRALGDAQVEESVSELPEAPDRAP